MTKGETQARALREAARLVMEVLAGLNAATEPCACCGRLQPADKIEHRAYEALSQQRLKLIDWAETLALPAARREDSPGARRAKRQRKPEEEDTHEAS